MPKVMWWELLKNSTGKCRGNGKLGSQMPSVTATPRYVKIGKYIGHGDFIDMFDKFSELNSNEKLEISNKQKAIEKVREVKDESKKTTLRKNLKKKLFKMINDDNNFDDVYMTEEFNSKCIHYVCLKH